KVRGARGGFVWPKSAARVIALRPDQSPREEIAQGCSAGAKQRERNRRPALLERPASRGVFISGYR
ncbi:MAG: hypothetical protein WCB55_25125, partial [Pseudolabrys sp.]